MRGKNLDRKDFVKSKVLFYHSFSIVRNDFGLYLGVFCIIAFVLRHHMKLHEINESTSKKSLAKYLIYIYIQCLFLTCLFFAFLEVGVQEKYIFIAHLKHFVLMLYFLIFLPKYYIHQNPSLKLYVKYYHYQPAPILPWQVPNNYDPDSVRLNVITME